MDPEDVDKTNHGRNPVVPAAADFADLLKQVLAEHDAKMEKRLEGVEKALKDLTDAFLNFNEKRRDEEAWRHRADVRFAELEARVARLEGGE